MHKIYKSTIQRPDWTEWGRILIPMADQTPLARDNGNLWYYHLTWDKNLGKWVRCITIQTTSAWKEVMTWWGEINTLWIITKIKGQLLRLISKYRRDFEEGVYSDERDFLMSGGEAQVCKLGNTQYVMREIIDDPLSWRGNRSEKNFKLLESMDMIHSLVNLDCPRWIDVPVHYWMIHIPQTNHSPGKVLTLIKKIDGWVTLYDIFNRVRSTSMEKAIIANFWKRYSFSNLSDPNYKLFQDAMLQKFYYMCDKLDKTFHENIETLPPWIKFKQLFSDLEPRNILITPSDSAVWGSFEIFHIIDQSDLPER